MKLSDIKGDEAFDVLADLIDPLTAIMSDAEVDHAFKNLPRLAFVKVLLKKHKKEITEILAILDRTPVEEYEVSLVALPVKVMELLNDPELAELFQSQGQTVTYSGSAMENTEVAEK